MDTLQKYKDKPLYEVPEHYFDQLQLDVMQRVKKEIKQQISFKKWASTISAAASIVLIVALSCFIIFHKNINTNFYVHEEHPILEDSMITIDHHYLSEATEFIITNDTTEQTTSPEPLFPKAPSVAANETIVYLAVDFYVDDFVTDNFYDTMYELESYYDY